MLPVEITIRDIENTEAIDAKIRKKVEKLEQIYDRISHCRVVVDVPQKNKHQGKEFQVNIELHVPGKKVLIVDNNSHRNEDLYVAIRDSFKAMESQLKDHVHIMRGMKKNHTPQLVGKIVRLFPDYGFIETSDGNEYYFHQANVHCDFANLDVGRTVKFTAATGGEGLQAQHVLTT